MRQGGGRGGERGARSRPGWPAVAAASARGRTAAAARRGLCDCDAADLVVGEAPAARRDRRRRRGERARGVPRRSPTPLPAVFSSALSTTPPPTAHTARCHCVSHSRPRHSLRRRTPPHLGARRASTRWMRSFLLSPSSFCRAAARRRPPSTCLAPSAAARSAAWCRWWRQGIAQPRLVSTSTASPTTSS